MRIHENIIIESKIPIAQILNLDMDHRLNEHGIFNMKIVIQPDMQHTFLSTSYLGQNIKFYADFDDDAKLIFSGKINNVVYEQQADFFTASIGAISYSEELDEEKKRRSFQNTGMSFRALLDLVTSDTNARFDWQVEGDRSLEKPFVQYDESDWEFAKRLASYFDRPIHANLLVGSADFYFGVRTGVGQNIDEATVLEQGVSDYYYENGGYRNDVPRALYYYLKVRNRESWQIGDSAMYENRKVIVIRVQAVFERGELTFIYTLGAEGFLHREIIYADNLVGLNLQGTIREVEKESITIQLDIDQDEQSDHLWEWMPEIGNFGYVMPEVGSRVVLTFPTKNEEDAYGSRLLRVNSSSGMFAQTENKQFVTAEDKTIGLFPDQVLFAGKNQDVKMILADQSGIRFDSHANIRMRASKEITLRGEQVTVVAPSQVLVQTSQSNIDIATNFNFFAPNGVNTDSDLPYDPPAKSQAAGSADPNHLPLSYGALGAMPGSVGVSSQGAMTNSAAGILPKMTGGQAAVAMNEMMNGTNANAASQSQAFSSMGSFSFTGGSRVPKKEID